MSNTMIVETRKITSSDMVLVSSRWCPDGIHEATQSIGTRVQRCRQRSLHTCFGKHLCDVVQRQRRQRKGATQRLHCDAGLCGNSAWLLRIDPITSQRRSVGMVSPAYFRSHVESIHHQVPRPISGAIVAHPAIQPNVVCTRNSARSIVVAASDEGRAR